MKKNRWLLVALFSFCLLLPACGDLPAPVRDGLDSAASQAADKLDSALGQAGEKLDSALDALENAEHKGGPFENNMDSARAYLLAQLEEKYGEEFAVVGNEKLKNYGPLAGASYSCKAAPAERPDQVFTALVSQTMYQKVRDSYPVYFYQEEAVAPVLALCEEKEYVLDQRLSLEMPGTAAVWTGEESLEDFLENSGSYVQVVLRLEDGLDTDAYAEQIQDFLGSVGGLGCDLLLQAKADKEYIYHRELSILEGFDPAAIPLEEIKDRIEVMKMSGSPRTADELEEEKAKRAESKP